MRFARLTLYMCIAASAAGAQKPPAKAATSKAAAPSADAPPSPKAPADTGLAMGTFVSSRLDGKKLPVRDLATDDQGVQYLIEFAELVLSLKANGEFRAGLRYRQTLARKGERTSDEPLQRMTVYGTWVREGSALRFVPDPKRGGEGLRILAGSAAGKSITLPFDYQNGRISRRATVLLIYDPKIF